MEFTKNDLKNFEKAYNASLYSSYPVQHFGAVIMNKSKVLTVGWNTDTELWLQKKYNSRRGFDTNKFRNPGHAEMHALHKLLNSYNIREIDRNDLSIYIWRGKDGGRQIARPCPACEAALKDFGIRHIYYTGDDSFVYEDFS